MYPDCPAITSGPEATMNACIIAMMGMDLATFDYYALCGLAFVGTCGIAVSFWQFMDWLR